ncbi:MAG TPA: DUF4286 family protein [Flavisolibacter sp.]
MLNDIKNEYQDADTGIIYNVTLKVNKSIADQWLQWLLKEHIPDVMGTGCFTHYRVVRLLEVDESEGPTYAVQYHALSKADYNRYITIHSTKMRDRSYDKWGEQFIAFRTVMQLVQ